MASVKAVIQVRMDLADGFFRFLGPADVQPIQPTAFVEVTDDRQGRLRHIGTVGTVESIDGRYAWIQPMLPVESKDPYSSNVEPAGERIRIPLRNLTIVPKPTGIRAGKIKRRRKHLREKKREKPT